MAIDDRQINPVDQKTAELLLNRRLNLLQAPRTGGDLDLRTSILDAVSYTHLTLPTNC